MVVNHEEIAWGTVEQSNDTLVSSGMVGMIQRNVSKLSIIN